MSGSTPSTSICSNTCSQGESAGQLRFPLTEKGTQVSCMGCNGAERLLGIGPEELSGRLHRPPTRGAVRAATCQGLASFDCQLAHTALQLPGCCAQQAGRVEVGR